jgi:hypothetical protein
MLGFKLMMKTPLNGKRIGFYSLEPMAKEMTVMFSHQKYPTYCLTRAD